MKYYSAIFFLFITLNTLADVRSFGHLLSRNDYLMENRRCTIGLSFSGCRIHSTLVGMSPFLFFGYDLNSLFIRQRISEGENFFNTLDVSFVGNSHIQKENDYVRYDMQTGMINLITTFKIQNKYKLNWNNSFFYYSNYRKPFSLRRPDPKVSRMQLNSTMLLENAFSENLLMASEIGFLQFNGQYPRVHAGASLDFHGDNFLLKFGFSVTSTWSGFFVSTNRPARNDYQQELLSTSGGFYQKLDATKTKYDFALHPEINYQYYF